jgi:hypothetical protein
MFVEVTAMGRSIRFRFSVAMKTVQGFNTPAGWQTKQAGRPTAANLSAYVSLYNDSLKPGGCNAHLGAGAQCVAATLRDHDKNVVVAEWRA